MSLLTIKEKDECEQQLLGFNYRMNDVEAALGISQIKRLDKIIAEEMKYTIDMKYCLGDQESTY